MGIALSTVQALRRYGHDASHLSEEGLERLPDPAILVKAARERRVIITCDHSFWLAALALPSAYEPFRETATHQPISETR